MADICVGQAFGRLIVLNEAEARRTARSNGRIRYFRVRCDCGTVKEVQRAALCSGATISCGCASRDRVRRHGMEGTKVYNVWSSMKARCQNQRHRAYKNYGGRGIQVCERWQKFENFYADMGDPTGVLDRIDNNGDYTPTNCRWTTWSESNKNQRRHMEGR